MTVLVQVFESGKVPEVLPPDDWVPWIKMQASDQLPVIVAKRFLRIRGGLAPDESKLDVTVFAHYPAMAKNANGTPFKVIRTELQFTQP